MEPTSGGPGARRAAVPATTRCDAHDAEDGYNAAHTCDDPVACALASLGEGPDPVAEELRRMHGLLDRIEELAGNSRAGACKTIVAWVHAERGGPR